MKLSESEAIDFLKTKYLDPASPLNPSEELCHRNNAALDLAIAALKEKAKKHVELATPEQIKEIVDYLNTVCGTTYRSDSEGTKRNINARFREKFTVEDFKIVIDKKAAEWMGTDMQKFLRPGTLFCTKFESYLNQDDKKSDRGILSAWRNA